MKRLIIFLFLISLIIPLKVHAQSGDIAFWLPESGVTSSSDTQVKRNAEYFSIKLHSVFAYYKSGFLENIKKLIVVSEISLLEENKSSIQSTMINKSWQKLDKNGDFIGVNDHLVVLSPATTTNVKIKVSFRGIGKDQFNILFDVLSDSTFKTALSLSPATSAIISAIAPTVQKLLASPYTAEDPRQMLDISQSYVLYADTKQLKPDSLHEGYLIIVSSRERKSDDLTKILSLDSKSIRLSPLGNGLEYKEKEEAEWKLLRNNSYVVLSVVKTPIRGENEYSHWFSKYTEAERFAEEKLLAGDPADKVKPEAVVLWREGNALLSADSNYIQNERVEIKGKHLTDLKAILLAKGETSKVTLDAKTLGVPSNFSELAQKYEAAVAKQSAQITVRTEWAGGAPLPNKQFRLTGFDASGAGAIVQTTNEKGEFVLKGLSPGKYKIESAGEMGAGTGVFIVDPKDKKAFEFKNEKKLVSPAER